MTGHPLQAFHHPYAYVALLRTAERSPAPAYD